MKLKDLEKAKRYDAQIKRAQAILKTFSRDEFRGSEIKISRKSVNGATTFEIYLNSDSFEMVKVVLREEIARFIKRLNEIGVEVEGE